MQTSDAILDRLMALHPKVIDLVLDRVHRLLDALDHPETHLPPVIHIAGTNGKGSTLAMIRAGLEGAGDSCHAYTSPHLARFHERIRLAGDLIAEDRLAELLAECEAANGGDPITYFEITTCAALLAFARTPADWTLLEVGLGGRLDATNVVNPALTVITPVSMDHEGFLGDTIEKIAGEKAGILKPGVPCIVGPQDEAALEVIEYRAARLNAPLHIHGQHWHVTEENGGLVFQDETGLMDLPPPRLIGAHQAQNAGMAVAALRVLGRAEGAPAAMRNATWPARMQRLSTGPLVDAAGAAEVWLDGGHNPAAGMALAEALTRLPHRPLHLICGMLNTKDARGYMRPLAARADHLHAVSIPGEPNTLSAAQTRAEAEAAGLPASEAGSVAEAIARITSVDPQARILICGSLYLAGRVLQQNG
ncbi:folylpolyglutamate synthase/dihydrofolate synthase family protein [Jannaschia sp. M317]|uniref:bifunctional folylpolyglutamate synthase/dihydrofolate synthase n=1 Tax=Jannaschia sp. M317 TaxID=2867011 RepID=UPI0021A89F0A|nr:folylpolyglutamate synthase/dihydrofolate synthase family protein [Jannaschia sp. M317]UWQ18207.1 bifunctional folylpolyglutamate synthase/dihydrofolate synthase [Jannaschia sp. M317]